MPNDSILPSRHFWHQIGDRIADRYAVRGFLGEGASAQVYEAKDEKLGIDVAIKHLNPYLETDPVSIERFRRELLATRQVQHPQVVTVYDLLIIEEGIFLVMELIRGIDLKQRLRRDGPFPIEQGIDIIRQLAQVLHACHQHGLIHRDLKPQNLILGPDGLLRLLDFGIARLTSLSDLTRTGTTLGSPEYMAPELFVTPSYDLRTDLYALGVIAYELITGVLPFTEDSIAALAHRHRTGKVLPPRELRPDTPLWLSTFILRCLEKEPIRRYQGCREILFDLSRGMIASEQLPTPADGICLACGTDRLVGLPFCPRCGRMEGEMEESTKRERYQIRLQQAPDKNRILTLLKTLFGSRLSPKSARRIRYRHPLIARGLDREECDLLAARIQSEGGSVQINREGIATRLLIIGQMGFHYLWVMGLAIFGSVTVYKVLSAYASENSPSMYGTREAMTAALWGSSFGHLLFASVVCLVIRDETATLVTTLPTGRPPQANRLNPFRDIPKRLQAICDPVVRDLLAKLITVYHHQLSRLVCEDNLRSDSTDQAGLATCGASLALAFDLAVGIDQIGYNLNRHRKTVAEGIPRQDTEAAEILLHLDEQKTRLMNRLIMIVSETTAVTGKRLAWNEPFTDLDLREGEAILEEARAEIALCKEQG